MRFNFKKVSAIGASILMAGLTMGTAMAANYPNPFVVGGSANVAIVYGTGSGVSYVDIVQAGNIQTNLQSYMGAGSGGTSVTTSGETVSLDTSATRIYLNTSLNTARASITKTELPTILGEETFSGNVDAKITQQIDIMGGTATGANVGAENHGRIIFAKQPKTNVDPVIGISIGTSAGAAQLYNVTATFKAVNFSNSDSEGETITLFGKDYIISTATDPTDLVLFSSAETVTLTKTSGENPSATVSISGTDYTVELLNGDSTTATVSVNGESKEITEGNSKKVGGIDIAVKSVTSSDVAGITATLLVGSEKLTFTHGTTVTKGSDDDPVDGTIVYLTGTATRRTGDCTALTVGVYAKSSEDAIAVGEEFLDPTFGSFKLDFAGLSSPLDDSTRDTIEVLNAGDDTMNIGFIDIDGNSFSQDFAHNQSSQWRLGDDSNYTIHTVEQANLSENEYVFVGNEDYGHLLQVTYIYNSTNGDHTKHQAKFQDVASGTTYETTFTSDTTGTVIVDGKTYTVTMNDASGGDKVQIKYPASDSAATSGFVIFPTVKTQRGALISLYEPLGLNLGTLNGVTSASKTFYFPDGDGYEDVTIAYSSGNANNQSWDIDGTPISLSDHAAASGSNYTTVTIGQLTYNFTATPSGVNSGAGRDNTTWIYLTNPENSATNIVNPGLIIFEEKNDNAENSYEAVVVDLKDDPAGSSTSGAEIDDIYFSTPYGHYAATLNSDSDVTQDMDHYGVLTTKDANDDQTTATISYPDVQMYAQLYIGEEDAVVTGTTSSGATALGDVLVKDSEVSSVSTKNLIVVGGSCINSAAATLIGGAYCGADWTTETGAGSGEYVLASYASSSITSGIALLVAGYEFADTANAVTYLKTQTVDTSKKYIGTSASSASEV